MIVTIDGQSCTGKTTISRALAGDFFHVIDIGKIYRYLSHHMLTHDVTISKLITESIVKRHIYNEKKECIINYNTLYNEKISKNSGELSENYDLYIHIKEEIIQYSKLNNIIIVGRNTGTEIFPKAEVKFFFFADISLRVQVYLKNRECSISAKELSKKLLSQDAHESNRKFNNLVKPNDAIEINQLQMELDKYILMIKSQIMNRLKIRL